MRKRIFDIIWAFLLVSSHLGFSYYYFDGWWYSFIGTLCIIFFSYLIWGKGFPEVTGLRIPLKKLTRVVLLTILVTLFSYLLIEHIGTRNGVALQAGDFTRYFHIAFYVLNEEMVLGGITLYILTKRLKMKPLLASWGLALAFAVIHFVFFRWVFVVSGTINFVALLTLFLIGVTRNNLILKYRHIGYSWALHFGWIVVMLGIGMYWLNSDTELTEPERFNIFLGSMEMIIISGLICCLSTLIMLRIPQGIKQ